MQILRTHPNVLVRNAYHVLADEVNELSPKEAERRLIVSLSIGYEEDACALCLAGLAQTPEDCVRILEKLRTVLSCQYDPDKHCSIVQCIAAMGETADTDAALAEIMLSDLHNLPRMLAACKLVPRKLPSYIWQELIDELADDEHPGVQYLLEVLRSEIDRLETT